MVNMAHHRHNRRTNPHIWFLIIFIHYSFAFSKASFSSVVNSYSDLPFFTGLAKMLIRSREYKLEITKPSPSSFNIPMAKLWLLPWSGNGLKRVVFSPLILFFSLTFIMAISFSILSFAFLSWEISFSSAIMVSSKSFAFLPRKNLFKRFSVMKAQTMPTKIAIPTNIKKAKEKTLSSFIFIRIQYILFLCPNQIKISRKERKSHTLITHQARLWRRRTREAFMKSA